MARSRKRKNGVILDYCEECEGWWPRDMRTHIHENFCPVHHIDLLPQKPKSYFEKKGGVK